MKPGDFCNNSKKGNSGKNIICQNFMSNDYVKIHVTKANSKNHQIIALYIYIWNKSFYCKRTSPSSVKAVVGKLAYTNTRCYWCQLGGLRSTCFNINCFKSLLPLQLQVGIKMLTFYITLQSLVHGCGSLEERGQLIARPYNEWTRLILKNIY